MLIILSAMIQLQPEIIMARISSAMNVASPLSTDDIVTEDPCAETEKHLDVQFENKIPKAYYQCLVSSSFWMRYLLGSWECHRSYYNHNHNVELRAKYLSPAWSSWLFGSGLDVSYFHSKSDWQLILRPYHRLPRSHSLFDFAAKGDIVGLQKILSAKEASVHDRSDSYGQTALHVSAQLIVLSAEPLTLFPPRLPRVKVALRPANCC